ncbi:FAD-binding oxidoreductase [Oleispirillum naphthae]|uniref:NAD(P)/FAD-dependent oxidoreductase n=1 Tax=Oleispirillum naphthae TaxID=2838853 RepID=UPI003082240D
MSHPVASIWAATAHPAPETPPIAGAHTADVAVIGAGVTGLGAAIKLAEGGASVIVLDSGGPGFGASGRNGGQVIPGLKHDPDELDKLYGAAATEFAGKTADVVFALIEKYGIDCAATRGGWIQGTLKTSHLPMLERRVAQWKAHGADVEMLDAAGIRRLTGTGRYVGGWIDRRAGTLHPLNYSYGLARAALSLGAQVHGGSEVASLKRSNGRWLLVTANGARIDAGHVVIGTNGYTGRLWPKLKGTVIPASSFQIATAPLSEEQLQRILPGSVAISDTRRIANYMRIGPGNRLMLGGRGTFSEPKELADYRRMVADLKAFFPETAGTPLDYYWSGRVAMTWDHMPRLHRPAPDMTIALGYNGRGVALGTAMGQAIGAHILDPQTPLPLTFRTIRPLPVHDLHPIYASMAIEYYRLRDSLEK